MPKIEKEIKLDFKNIPRNKQSAAKKEVADFLEVETLSLIGEGKSPVKGERFKKLTKEYADKEKGGNRTPTLELEGDLLEAFSVKPSKAGVKMKVAAGQSDKADGHNQLTSKAKAWAKKNNFPKRRYIPGASQKLKPGIVKEIDSILDDFREPERVPTRPKVTPRAEEVDEVSVTIRDLFTEESIIDALIRELRGS